MFGVHSLIMAHLGLRLAFSMVQQLIMLIVLPSYKAYLYVIELFGGLVTKSIVIMHIILF